ncbi:hypothetical protein [Streptomyces yaizuensis]|uniref:Uncharacterized protein n=1 Tax=Streptomyces yaizuensis TaxID=2989713 RepID=A0ABQ5P3M3_9ACTN|nr:hypothetical protein [Streptomyces sp. YSPA8]GLF97198.1 hypothetical protein SYYSPA8_22895 [Streptomyces sp. YSPA8]
MRHYRHDAHDRRARAATGGAVAAALAAALLVPGGPATAAPEPASVTPKSGSGSGSGSVALATGDRAALAPADGGADGGGERAVRLVPRTGQDTAGRYAFVRRGGELTLSPAGQDRALPASTLVTDPAARSAPAARAGRHKVRITLTGATAAGPVIQVWNRKTWQYHEVREDQHGTDGTVSLPPGDYLVIGMYSRMLAPDHLLSRTFTVKDRALTVTMDGKAARETAVTADDTSARRASSAVSILLPNGEVVGFMGGGAHRVYVTPFALKGMELRIHDVLEKKGSSANVPSPYRYDLVKVFKDRIPATPRATVRKADLSRTVLTLRSPGTDTVGWLSTGLRLGMNTGSVVTTPVRLPATITEYATPRARISRSLDSPDGPDLRLYEDVLVPGQNPGRIIGAAPYGVTACEFPRSELDGTRLVFAEPCAFGDAWNSQGTDPDAVEDLLLTTGGTVLAEGRGRALGTPWRVDLREGGVPHTLTQTVRHTDSPRRYTRSQTSAWTFTPGGPHVRPGELPLTDAHLRVSGLDLRNTAGSAPVTVTVTASSRVARLAAVPTSLAYSTDDGSTWTPLTLNGPLTYRKNATFTVPPGARYVSLRAGVRGADGTTLTRTLVRAFGGPAAVSDEHAGPIRISQVSVHGGKPVVPDLWDNPGRTYAVKYTVHHPTGIEGSGVRLYRGSFTKPAAVLTTSSPQCVRKNASTSACTAWFALNAHTDLGRDAFAGEWRVSAYARATGTGHSSRGGAATTRILRLGNTTADGPDGRVTRGRAFTVTGAAQAADWATGQWAALPKRSVRLEFRKKGTDTYVRAGEATTDAKGRLKAAPRADTDGYWRWSVPASTTTAAKVSAGVYVDVR